jgi:hypothetical protein
MRSRTREDTVRHVTTTWRGYVVEDADGCVGTVSGIAPAPGAAHSLLLSLRLADGGSVGYVALADVACVDSARRVVTLQQRRLRRRRDEITE